MKFLDQHPDLYIAFMVVYVAVIIYTLYRILMDTNNATKALAYILLVVLIPLLGVIFYFSFGINYRKHKIYTKQIKVKRELFSTIGHLIRDQYSDLKDCRACFKNYAGLAHYMLHDAQELIAPNNYKLLINGEEKFPALFEEIEKAQEHIHIEYYIWNDEERGRQLIHLIQQKAAQGVEVRVIYDAFGSDIGSANIEEMKRAGVQIFPIMEIQYMALANRLNHRDHRKLVVIDGRVGFLGGINVSDKYDNGIDTSGYWRDTHLMIKGPTVGNLQRHFIANWNFCADDKLTLSDAFFPLLDFSAVSPDQESAQIVAGGPDYTRSHIQHTFNTIITKSQEKLYIATPYFIPNESLLASLKQAALTGVDVRLMIPENADYRIVGAATKYYLRALLKAGVRVFLYSKGFLHAKTIVADGFLSMVGSANLDIRSLDLNYELNAIVYGEKFAAEMETQYMNDLNECVELTYEDWQKIPKWKELGYAIARLISYFL